MNDFSVIFKQTYGKSINELTDAELQYVSIHSVLPGYCHCGCGQKVSIRRGKPRGEFKRGHNTFGEAEYRYTNKAGYTCVRAPNHPKAASNKGYVYEHILIAEAALGKYLPDKAQVHHHNQDQLVICEDDAYHKLLHRRMRALRTCGHANWRICEICGAYDDPDNLKIIRKSGRKTGTRAYHSLCNNDRARRVRYEKSQ